MREFVVSEYGMVPDAAYDQTEQFQKILDLCKEEGGKVVIPAGTYRMSSVRMWSDTEIYLQKGARLEGSSDCNEYKMFELPEGLELFTDQQAFARPYYFFHTEEGPYPFYRRAMISAYGEKNLTIVGEEGSVIDGMDCYDPEGEENFRGPHGIFFSSCSDIRLQGYTICNTGNFMHQLDNCTDVVLERITALAGHDGIHLHMCKDMKIVDCYFHTGDDCIAGCDVQDLTVTGCDLNTSCNVFRLGGRDILIENNKIEGPGEYPHRLSLVGQGIFEFEKSDGRHNTISLFEYFASKNFANREPARDIVIRNCAVTGVDSLMHYEHDKADCLHAGMDLEEIVFENVTVEELLHPSYVVGSEELPVKIKLKNVTFSYRDSQTYPLFDAKNVILEENSPA